MRDLKYMRPLFLLLLCVVLGATLSATAVLQMNLEKLVTDSASVFRGTVVSVKETTVQLGGGDAPAVVYQFKVDESFKGAFTETKGVRLADVMMIGTLKQVESGRAFLPGFPVLRVGQEYLMMVAPNGPVGLTSTMGLGQGCFEVSGRDGGKVALNGANNSGLFNGMSAPGMPASGPIAYDALADMIRGIVGGSN